MNEPPLIYALDLVGTASFAFSGAIRGLPRRPDIVGMIILAGATAVGGGAVRDLLLGNPVSMVRDMNYLLVIVGSAIVAWIFPGLLSRRKTFFQYFDAVGLGIFSAIGGNLAMNVQPQLNPLSVLFIACITGAGGGVIRDVLLGEMPLVLYREVYITAVAAGAGAMMVASYFGANQTLRFLIAMVVTLAIRIPAIAFEWSLPRLPGGPRNEQSGDE